MTSRVLLRLQGALNNEERCEILQQGTIKNQHKQKQLQWSSITIIKI